MTGPLLALLLACASPPPAALPPARLWPGEDLRPSLDHSFFESHSLEPLSLFADCVEGPGEDRPDAAHRGPFAVGNGRAFGMMGLADPLHRLHNAVGPTYDKGDRFFSDRWFRLEVDGAPVAFDRECIARPRGSGLVLTRADAGDVQLYTVDLAPQPEGQAAPPAILRFLLLHTEASHRLLLREEGAVAMEIEGDSAVQRFSDGTGLALLALDRIPDTSDEAFTLDFGTLEAGGEATAATAYAFSTDEEDGAALSADLRAADPEAWLEQTLAWWADASALGLQLESEDPRVVDLYDGMRTSLLVQTTEGGGVAPMSRYTGVWLRDTIGPTRFLLRAGLGDQAHAALDYLHLCHATRGDYGNSCSSGLDPTDLPEEPDWASMGAFTGRTAAEGPSYVPLAWLDLADWTDAPDLIDQHWDYLARGVLAQQMDEEGRQPFSGDETWRLVMNVSVGLPLEYPWEDLAWSADSSLLSRAAAGRLAQAGEALGRVDAADTLRARGDLATRALEETFLQPEGYLAPYVFHSAGSDNEAGDVAPAPFEDVNLSGIWAGAYLPTDPIAQADLESLLAVAGRGDGTIQSHPAPVYEGQDLFSVEVNEGVATGMVPGFTLSVLTAMGHPEAEAAYDALRSYAGPSGQYPEDLLYDDMSALQVYYDESGALGDICARYRPWEGAIDLDAMLAFLIGAQPMEGGGRLRPHLPGDQRQLGARGLQIGAARGSLTLTQEVGRLTARFTSESDAPFLLWWELPLPEGAEPWDTDGGWVEALPMGERLVRFTPRVLHEGETSEVEVQW